ncbi:hypothetical protein 2 [Hubei sobemo-like virus 1]|uniref:hypothetical protein 2 n=1 Tax=Hubei sobemo-like virus 1 TaxID=1923194 RepID=UPI00090C023D|nr:hypothetical protein 2 [Hubei sobemo-like virus 1]APG75885.1 hypothetical protein 2 [Hubei sobemo-like virus 1]
MRIAATNKELLELHWSLVENAAVARLQLLEEVDYEDLRAMSASELVEGGYTDEVRVFVKNELHSRAKVAEGRMRLIMSVSVVDQIVERVLNSAQNQLEISKWETISSKPGMGLDDDSLFSIQEQVHKLGSGVGDPVSSDISGFDWSVPQWALDLDARVRAALSGAPTWLRVHEKRAVCLGLSQLVFSDGVVWDQLEPGIQKSGSYNTSSTNSRIRVMLAWLVARRIPQSRYGGRDALEGGGRAMAMGDDAIETTTCMELLKPNYERLGFVLKEVSRDIEFCAYAFDLAQGYRPLRVVKMVAGLLRTAVRDEQHEEELRVALEYELRHSDKQAWAKHVIRASGWGARK